MKHGKALKRAQKERTEEGSGGWTKVPIGPDGAIMNRTDVVDPGTRVQVRVVAGEMWYKVVE